VKYAYGVVGLVAAISAVAVGVFGMMDVMIVSALLAALLIIAGNADRIARIKAGTTGFEAETRALIDKAIATIDQLRTVAKIAVQANLSLVMRSGRWGGFTHDEKERIRMASVAALDSLDVPKEEREEMFREWHMVNRFDYVHNLLGGNTIPVEIQEKPDLQSEWKRLRNGGFEANPASEVVEKFLRRAGMLGPERVELLEDYRHYERHGEHRRADAWKKLHDSER
jgi:hypothetical protein